MGTETAGAVAAWVAVGAAVAGTGYSVYSSKQTAAFQSAVAARNAQLAAEASRDAKARGAIEERRVREEESTILAAQRATLAESGVDITTEGSALSALVAGAGALELDAQTTRANAYREALGYKTQRNDFIAGGALDRLRARYGATSSLLAGVGSTIGAYGSVRSSYMFGHNPGVS